MTHLRPTTQGKTDVFKILWAVDPLAKELKLQETASWVIRAIAARLRTSVEPVFVEHEAKLDAPRAVLERLHADGAEIAQQKLNKLIGRKKLGNLLPLHFLTSQDGSLKTRAELLLRYAHEVKADLIVASTRSRKGPFRWFLGSFVETLSLMSDLPLLVVNPEWNKRARFDRILFPTDFSDASREVFQTMLPVAKKLKSEIVIFHKFSEDVLPLNELLQSVHGLSKSEIDCELHTREHVAQQWMREAVKAGNSVQVIFDRKSGETAAEAIIRQTKNWPGLVAMAGESNTIEACLLGSITRNVMRSARCPVWVIHASTCGEGKVIANRPKWKATTEKHRLAG